MSDSLRPHRQQPTRLLCPWDSLGKNTGVGCHFLLQCMKVKSEREVAQLSLLLATPWTAAHQAPLSMGFSRREYWCGLPFPSPKGNLRAEANAVSKAKCVAHRVSRAPGQPSVPGFREGLAPLYAEDMVEGTHCSLTC